MTKTTQNTSLLHNNTINPNDGNSQETTQSMLENAVSDTLNLLEKSHLAETNDFLTFQQRDNHSFDKKRHVKLHKNTPNYRRMSHYVKSIRQYKRERARRKRVRQLSGEGKTYPQIAKELGISERTVARDMKKMSHYQIGQFHKALRKLEQDQIDKFNKETAHLNPVQKFQVLTELLIKRQSIFKMREYNRHQIKIIINMNDLTDGCPSITFWPKPPWSLTHPIYFDFYVEHGEQTKCVGGLIQK
jgi:DNA-binding CsgD family transcriptional regulator